MRHHFTKSERLALEMATDPWIEFTDMESGRIRKGPWLPATTTMSDTRTRRVRRVVTFVIADPRFPQQKGMKISLEGWEAETKRIGGGVRSETTWRISRIMIGWQNFDEPIMWRKLHIPDDDSNLPIHWRFPRFLMKNQPSVASPDA